jgi:hypothetical protein
MLTDAIASEGMLRNPPIVIALPTSAGQFLVLDGANRTHALQQLEIPYIVAQVVDPVTDTISVQTWNHAVIDGSSQDLIQQASLGSRISAEESKDPIDAAKLRDRSQLAGISDPDGRQWQIRCEGSSLTEHIGCLDHLVELYAGASRIERTNEDRADALSSLYPDLSYVVVFPEFVVADVVEVAAQGRLFPSGLTRFVISPRALRLNYPLQLLSEVAEIHVLQDRLRTWIDEMLENRSVRFYAEATFVFDE